MISTWETKKLAEVAELQGRIGWKGLTAKEYTSDGPYFLSVHSLNHGDQVDFRDAFHISQKRYDESPEIMLRCDDVLICKDGAGIGKVGIVGAMPGPSSINSSLLLIRAKPSILPKYLYHVLQSPYFQAIVQSRLEGATTPHLYQRDISTFPVQLPPLDEQRRIVAVLDEAFAAIVIATANAEKNLANARDLFDRVSSELLTVGRDDWREYSLDEVCTISSKLVDPRLDEFIDLPHIGAGNMASRTGELGKVLTAREEGLISGKFLFDPTMVLYSKIRPYLMKACRPDFAGLCSADVYPLVPIEGKLDRNFLFQTLLSRGFTTYAEAGSARAGMPKVNRDHLFGYRIKLPPIEKQRELAERVDALADDCRNLIGCLEAKLSALASLKQSLLHRAFSGTLTATVPLATNDNWKTPSFAAQVIGLAYRCHLARGTEATFGRVKAQKTLHLCESVGMVDMGRNPVKDAAGPNDFHHMLAAEDWAKANEFFEFVQRPSGNGYSFRKLRRFDAMIADGSAALKPVQDHLERAIALIAPMNSEEAELLATVHAAWNNLILDGVESTEDAIIREARENWHPSKLKFSDGKFREAIAAIRAKRIVPDGSAKRVGGQEALAF